MATVNFLLTCCFGSLDPSDDLSNKDSSSHDLLKAQLQLFPLNTKMEAFLHQRVRQAIITYHNIENNNLCVLVFF